MAHQLETDLAKLQRENKSLRAASLDWKAECERLKAESSELKKENERLQIQLGIQTQVREKYVYKSINEHHTYTISYPGLWRRLEKGCVVPIGLIIKAGNVCIK